MLDVTIRQTFSKLEEELKKKSISYQKEIQEENNPSEEIFVETSSTAT